MVKVSPSGYSICSALDSLIRLAQGDKGELLKQNIKGTRLIRVPGVFVYSLLILFVQLNCDGSVEYPASGRVEWYSHLLNRCTHRYKPIVKTIIFP